MKEQINVLLSTKVLSSLSTYATSSILWDLKYFLHTVWFSPNSATMTFLLTKLMHAIVWTLYQEYCTFHEKQFCSHVLLVYCQDRVANDLKKFRKIPEKFTSKFLVILKKIESWNWVWNFNSNTTVCKPGNILLGFAVL